MTREEKLEAVVSELLGAVAAIAKSQNHRHAKVIASTALAVASIISSEGKIPTRQEVIETLQEIDTEKITDGTKGFRGFLKQ